MAMGARGCSNPWSASTVYRSPRKLLSQRTIPSGIRRLRRLWRRRAWEMLSKAPEMSRNRALTTLPFFQAAVVASSTECGAGFDQRAEFLAGMSGPPARPAPDMVVGVEISYDKGVVRVVDIYNRGGGGESVQVHWLPRHPLSNVEAGSGNLRSGYAGPDQVEVSPGLLR